MGHRKPAAAKKELPPLPDIWLQEHEASGHLQDCSCRLVAEYAEPGFNGSPAFFMCPLHRAAGQLLQACKAAQKHWGRLHDIISDLVEEGKLTEAQYPDDYDAIVLALTKANEAETQAEKAIAKAEPPPKAGPDWFGMNMPSGT